MQFIVVLLVLELIVCFIMWAQLQPPSMSSLEKKLIKLFSLYGEEYKTPLEGISKNNFTFNFGYYGNSYNTWNDGYNDNKVYGFIIRSIIRNEKCLCFSGNIRQRYVSNLMASETYYVFENVEQISGSWDNDLITTIDLLINDIENKIKAKDLLLKNEAALQKAKDIEKDKDVRIKAEEMHIKESERVKMLSEAYRMNKDSQKIG